jgi:xanthine dehydrogenase/oxidase
LFLGSAAFFAIREAVRAYRLENGQTGYFRMDSPATPERIRMACEDGMTKSASCHPATGQSWTVEL